MKMQEEILLEIKQELAAMNHHLNELVKAIKSHLKK